MSFQLNLPPSVLSHMGKEEDANIEGGTEEKRKGREDYKKLKELEEARKAGTAPAMKDEHGKDINPHIPQYIMQAPWYYGATSATLRHQRQQEDQIPKYDSMNAWYKKGVKSGPIATKYRKGACENCGAMTHKKKDCLERPRKKGARFTGSNIAPDEHLQTDIKLDFEGKRDRWNGYDIDNHKKIIEDYAIMEEAKRMVKAQRLESDVLAGSPDDEKETSDGDEEDEDKYADEMDMPGQKFETKQRITVRNLRIREDTAKYLHNLDVNSAHYDPKTRSMRENPFKNKTESATYTGDNFVRTSGDAMEFAKRQMFAWDAYEKGTDVHLQADPTKLDVLAREYKKRKEDFKQSVKDNILDKYGGEEHLEAPPKQLLLAQTEDYIEYSRHGTVIKGQEKAKVKSRYEEDVYINNHTSVWGSFWKGGQWGYKCCHSTVQGSYCTGESGKQAAVQSVSVVAIDPQGSATQQKSLTKTPDRKRSRKQSSDNKKRRRKQSDSSSSSSSDSSSSSSSSSDSSSSDSSSSSSDSSSSSSEDEDAAKERKIQEAMKKEAKRREEVDRLMALDERKRPYNSMCEIRQPTEEEMEAHRRTQLNPNDPMAAFLTKK